MRCDEYSDHQTHRAELQRFVTEGAQRAEHRRTASEIPRRV
jgi:hypothetical protein